MLLNYLWILGYCIVILYTIIRILLDTQSTPKTLAYLLLVLVFPVVGVVFYFSFGINYRHRKSKLRIWTWHQRLTAEFNKNITDESVNIQQEHPELLGRYLELISFINTLGDEHLGRNQFKLLLNGEEKFPEVLRTLASAERFIHMEYYSWENDVRGNQIKEALLKKASEGVNVRVLYDDYASRKIKNNIVRELQAGGVQIYPVMKVKLRQLANRINHRDHRKLIIVDGHTGFVGGINVSDRYDNSIDTGLYWRDTHVKITGATVLSLQRNFLVNWNSHQNEPLSISEDLFPQESPTPETGEQEFAQIVAGGAIYTMSNIMLTYFRLFTEAKKKLYITNPYFIPSASILDALKQAAVSGVDVRLILPEKSDSAIVGAASKFFFTDLLHAGVRIFLYKKGFVHAKTAVIDGELSVVGTANMDIRSFDLNFEIMSVIYGRNFGKQLEGAFLDDLMECREITHEEWSGIGIVQRLTYAIARLISSFL